MGIGNENKKKEGDKGHIMHYKLVVGVLMCLGPWVTKKRDKMTKIKKQNEKKKYIYIYI